jgi:hypothetical protein
MPLRNGLTTRLAETYFWQSNVQLLLKHSWIALNSSYGYCSGRPCSLHPRGGGGLFFFFYPGTSSTVSVLQPSVGPVTCCSSILRLCLSYWTRKRWRLSLQSSAHKYLRDRLYLTIISAPFTLLASEWNADSLLLCALQCLGQALILLVFR